MIAIPKELDGVLDFSNAGMPALLKKATKKQQEIYLAWKKEFETPRQNKFQLTEH